MPARIVRLLVCVTAASLAGCSRADTPLGPQTIADPTTYLVQLRCPDGRLEVAEQNCPGAAAQRASDPMRMRRRDWPAPDGYLAQDAIMGAYGPETLWSFSPSGGFVAAHGDGGEVYVVDGGAVRIALTQDGGKPYLQGFYGAHCGGTGWVAFRTDAPTGRWADLIAHLSDRRTPSFCLAFSAAFTRYRLENVAAPWIVDGEVHTIARSTVIAEHYDRASIAQARNMERSFFAKGAGRIIWEAWTTGGPTGAGLAARCPGTAWSTPPAVGWVLSDCRYATNLVAADGQMSGAAFGWPGARVGPLP